MDTTIVEKILKGAKGKLDACEVCFTISESKEANYSSNKLKSSEGKGSRSIAARGFKNGKMGFYVTSDLSSPEAIVAATVELANEGGPHEIELPADFGNATVDTYDEKVANLTPADLVGTGRALIGIVREYDPKYLNEAQAASIVEHTFLANSRGGKGQHKSTLVSASISPSLADESGFMEIYEFEFSTHMPANGFNFLGHKVIDKLKFCEKDAKAATGDYEILLMPKAVDIFNTLLLAVNARAVLKGYSPWSDKLRSKVADGKLEIIDDPLRPGHAGSQPFDDEGTPSKRKALIEDGFLRVFLNDLFSAAKLGQEPTGNAFRMGKRSEPRASASTLFITEGKRDFAALVSRMKKGIIVDQIMGAHTASPFSGDFSVNINMGWLVENGEIAGRVKDCMLAGNVFGWIKDNIVEIGHGSERASASVCIPPILFAGAKIATTG